ncbi:MAG: lipoate--protein ligase [Bacteroidales bacterium]|nr:lipoate--protein ligase [Bacteroidales bacterium]
MFCLNPETTDPFYNLAVEEVLLKNSQDEFLILGINSSSVIIGKHQVAHRESDTRFVTTNHIPVIRRISGGGTVYHDPGNLNFTFILNSEKGRQVDFRKYTLPVINFLASLGVDAKFEGKNDLKVDGFKISGNAEHVYRNRVLHHGTLLYDSDMNMLRGSLRKDTGQYITRAVGSNPSKVTNLKAILKDSLKDSLKDLFSTNAGSPGSVYGFRSLMLEWFLENYPETAIYELSDSQKRMAEELAVTKYRTWEWNFAYGPDYCFNNSFNINGLDGSCRLCVKEGIITECEVTGFKGADAISSLLKASRHMVEDIGDLINNITIIESGLDIFNFF